MFDIIKGVFGLGKTTNSESPSISVDKVDVIKSLRTAIFVGAAGMITYLLSNVGHIDFGQYTAVVVPALTFVLELAHRYLKDNSGEVK